MTTPSSTTSQPSTNQSSSVFQEVLNNSNNAQSNMLGPTYDYYKYIKMLKNLKINELKN